MTEGRFAGQSVAGFGAVEMVVRTSGYWPEGAVPSGGGAVGVLVGIVLPAEPAGEWSGVGAALGWEVRCSRNGSWTACAGVGGVRVRVALMTPLNSATRSLF